MSHTFRERRVIGQSSSTDICQGDGGDISVETFWAVKTGAESLRLFIFNIFNYFRAFYMKIRFMIIRDQTTRAEYHALRRPYPRNVYYSLRGTHPVPRFGQ